VRAVNAFKNSHPDKEIKLFIIGKNAFDFFKRRSMPILEKWISFGGKVSYDTAKIVSARISDSFLKGEFEELYIVHNEFRSTATQYPKTEKLLPLVFEQSTTDEESAEYIFEPGSTELLDAIIPRFIDFTIYHCLLESAAGEHGARMVAMDNATRSADDMLKKLTLNYNKARQAAITTDLLDIVNGAEALK
jgi:F-type H+-transporting ATPase subunit gamma